MSRLRIALAFLRKDFLEEASYRFSFLLGIVGMLVSLFFLSVFAGFVGPAIEPNLEAYGGSFLAFVVLGLGFHNLQNTSVGEVSRKIRVAQTLGTLEALIATRTPLPVIVVCLPLYTILRTTMRLVLYLALGVLLFDLEIHLGNWPAALLLLLLAIGAFGTIGLAYAALTVVFKRTEPLITVFSVACFLLGGIFYPVAALPGPLQSAAYLLPITPALSGIRTALMRDGTWAEVLPHAGALALFTALCLPASMILFRWAIRRAMRDGTLTQY